MPGRAPRRSVVFAAVVAALVSGPAAGPARAAPAVRTPDGESVLLSRDVASERWAITRNPRGTGTVTGNLFGAGEDPLFVWCAELRASEVD